MTNKIMIEGHNIHKYFKDFWGRPKVMAVNGVDISVKQGSVFGLLGPNGAGKSTLMKIFLGHLYPTKGNITVLGKDPKDVESKNKLGYLPEKTCLYKNLTARETLQFFGEILNLNSNEIKLRIEQLLDMVGLAKSADRLVGEFSHGMGRRMGLAQALINDPDLILLDEPTAGLDPIGCREVKDLIATLSKRGKTILLTSHLLSDVQDVCNEIMILYGGKIQAQGSISELLADRDILELRMPSIEAQQADKIKNFIYEEIGEEIELSNPTVTLEKFFLDIVKRANSNNIDTGGAKIGKGVASYLKKDIKNNDVLSSLTKKEPKNEIKEVEIPNIDLSAIESLEKKKNITKNTKIEKKIDKSTLEKITKM